jgi:hypothetical protein
LEWVIYVAPEPIMLVTDENLTFDEPGLCMYSGVIFSHLGSMWDYFDLLKKIKGEFFISSIPYHDSLP